MERRKITRAARNLSSAAVRLRRDNPLLVRKKLQMKNVYFRQDHPETELFRWEIAWDTEVTVLLFALGAAAALLLLKAARRRTVRQLTRRCLGSRRKA